MRSRKPGRLADIADAALAVFTRQGYRLTQMADVAREAGLSAGALYSYVDGKEALLELALVRALGEAPLSDAPFAAGGLRELGPWLAEALPRTIAWPALAVARGNPRLAPADLEAVALELYELVGTRRHLVWLLDRCANEVAELAGLYETMVRGRYMGEFAALVRQVLEPQGIPEEVAAATARALLEMIVWMGMHRLRDRLPPPAGEAAVRAAVLRIVRLSLPTDG